MLFDFGKAFLEKTFGEVILLGFEPFWNGPSLKGRAMVERSE